MVELFRSTFGLPAGSSGEVTISSKDLYRISAAPNPALVGKAIGQFVPGAISYAPATTYKSTLEAQNAGLQQQVLNTYAKKQSTTASKIITEDKIATGGGNITTPQILDTKDQTESESGNLIKTALLIAGAVMLFGGLK